MQQLSPEQLSQRQQCEMIGMFNSRRGIVMYYCSVLGLHVQEAKESIDLECELRGIPKEISKPEPQKDFWEKADTLMSKGADLIVKYPIIEQVGAPLLKTAVTAAGAAFLGAFAGNTTADNVDDTVVDDNSPIIDLDDVKQPPIEASDTGAENVDIKIEEFEVVK